MGRSCSSHARPRLPKRLFYGELKQGKRSFGGQKKRFKDTLKTSMKVFDVNPDTWEQTAMDRASWHCSVHKDASLCEERRTAAAQHKRQARKARASNQEQVSHIACQGCHRIFRASIGLISHLCTHKVSHFPQSQDGWNGPRRLDGRTHKRTDYRSTVMTQMTV